MREEQQRLPVLPEELEVPQAQLVPLEEQGEWVVCSEA